MIRSVQVKKSFLDPRTKLVLVLIESVLVLATAGGQRMFWFRLVFAAMPFVLLAVTGKIKPCLIGGALLGLVEYLHYAVFPSATGILAGVLVILVTVVNRFIPAILMGIYVVQTTKVSEFKAAMDRMHPLSKEHMAETMAVAADRFGDVPYVAVSDDGSVQGFFCYSFNNETKEGVLKFVVVDPDVRGKGVARKMLGLAVKQAFENPETERVQLNVFP